MYYLMGFKKNLENVKFLSGYLPDRQKRISLERLRGCFRDYLRTIQPAFTVASDGKPELVSDVKKSRELMKFAYRNTTDFHVKRLRAALTQRAVPISKERKLKLLKNGLRRMARLDPELMSLFNLVINKIFYYELTNCGGGSTPEAYGIIFSNPNLSWNTKDMIEYYVHELTHNLVYLDEECHSHYKDYHQLNLKRNYAFSAIRGQKRRLDLALHSLIVGTELLLLREKKLGHPRVPGIHPTSETLITSCEDTVRSIQSLPWQSLLANGGKDIFTQCEATIMWFRKKY